jgi:hypothetical protein
MRLVGPSLLQSRLIMLSLNRCIRNSQICEYKERKKPGLRAGQYFYLLTLLRTISKIHKDMVES